MIKMAGSCRFLVPTSLWLVRVFLLRSAACVHPAVCHTQPFTHRDTFTHTETHTETHTTLLCTQLCQTQFFHIICLPPSPVSFLPLQSHLHICFVRLSGAIRCFIFYCRMSVLSCRDEQLQQSEGLCQHLKAILCLAEIDWLLLQDELTMLNTDSIILIVICMCVYIYITNSILQLCTMCVCK